MNNKITIDSSKDQAKTLKTLTMQPVIATREDRYRGIVLKNEGFCESLKNKRMFVGQGEGRSLLAGINIIIRNYLIKDLLRTPAADPENPPQTRFARKNTKKSKVILRPADK